MIQFDIDSDGRFAASLQDLGVDGQIDVLTSLEQILARELQWDQFVADHGWQALSLKGQDTSPGGMELHVFHLAGGESGKWYEVFAFSDSHVIVVCSVARDAVNKQKI